MKRVDVLKGMGYSPQFNNMGILYHFENCDNCNRAGECTDDQLKEHGYLCQKCINDPCWNHRENPKPEISRPFLERFECFFGFHKSYTLTFTVDRKFIYYKCNHCEKCWI